MGAWAATQEDDPRFQGRQVVSVTGDGGFGQYMGELTTAVKYGMNITHVLLNNDELGKISKEQRAGNWEVWQTDLHNPNFAEYAELCGALGIRVTRSRRAGRGPAEGTEPSRARAGGGDDGCGTGLGTARRPATIHLEAP